MRWLKQLFGSAVPPRTRTYRAVLLVLLVASSLYRVALILQYNPMGAIWSDPARHWISGTQPLGSGPMAAVDPVLYGAYLSVIAKLTVGSPVLVAYWTALLSLSGPWLWYRYLRELLPHRDQALLGWVLLSLMPSWSAIYSYFMQETLLLPLLGAALWATWRCRRKKDRASFLIATLAWLLAGLTRGICIPLAAVAMTWLWLSQTDKWGKAIFATVLLVAVLGPLAGRSWSIARVISPHGIGSLAALGHQAGTSGFSLEFSRRGGADHWNLYFESPSAFEEPLEPLSSWRNQRRGSANFQIDLDAGRRDWRLAREALPKWTLQRYLWLTGENQVYLWFGHSWPDTDRRRYIGEANRWTRWIWAPLAIVCIVGTAMTWQHQRDRLLPALLITWFVVQGVLPLAFNEGRYRKPAEGMLVAQALLLTARRRPRTMAAASIGKRSAGTVESIQA